MSIRPFETMISIDDVLKEDIVNEQKALGMHGPHNFVESAEGTIAGFNMSDPQTRELIDGLDEVISDGYPDIKRELEDF
jgi:hypothetical protein